MTVKTIGKYDGFRLSTEGGKVVLRLKKGDKIYLKPLDGGGIVPCGYGDEVFVTAGGTILRQGEKLTII
ncbi:MAG: hypothetical protein IJC01_01845 [Clostridia bacterium]|nr:hypothetical protein [Clostridia bacterium]